jgi:ATP-binding cassette, subfamily B, bacterial
VGGGGDVVVGGDRGGGGILVRAATALRPALSYVPAMTSRRRLGLNLVRGIGMAWRASRAHFLAMAALALFTAALPALEVWLGKHLIDLIIAHDKPAAVPTAIGLGVVFGVHRLLGSIRFHLQDAFSQRVVAHVMREFLAKAASIDIGHLDDPSWHDRASRARRDADWLPAQMTYMTFEILGSSATVIGMVGLLSTMHPALGGLALVSVMPWLLIQRRITRRLFEFRTTHTAADRERDYMASLLAEPEFAKEVRSFGLTGHFLDRFTRISDENLRERERLLGNANWWTALSGLWTTATVGVAYYFLGARGLNGELTPGDLAAAFGAFTLVASEASLMAFQFGQLERFATFLDDYFAFMAVEPLLPLATHPTRLPAVLKPGVVLEGVHFMYPRGTREALAGLDLEVRPGELVALVGENGAGKTTIVNLLSRFYDPTAGRVLIGGVDLREVDPAELRSRLGVLLQDFVKYQLTLRDNVQLGRLERAASDQDIMASLEAARARFLLDQANGLGVRVGRLFDGGHELSGGEWQRLALARLIFRGADLWILDEPTSNLDPEAEAAIFAELKHQLAGRMAIVISHRFSTVRVADRIYVIESGRVLESGSHDELVAARGRYADLFEVQAAGYR